MTRFLLELTQDIPSRDLLKSCIMVVDDGRTNAARSARKENLAGAHSGDNREANVGKRISSGALSA